MVCKFTRPVQFCASLTCACTCMRTSKPLLGPHRPKCPQPFLAPHGHVAVHFRTEPFQCISQPVRHLALRQSPQPCLWPSPHVGCSPSPCSCSGCGASLSLPCQSGIYTAIPPLPAQCVTS